VGLGVGVDSRHDPGQDAIQAAAAAASVESISLDPAGVGQLGDVDRDRDD
jgi:hypothetical protein